MNDEYQFQVSRGLLSEARYAGESALEYARELLARHDAELGRTTRKNRQWAETLEADILRFEAFLNNLPKTL